MCTSLYMFQIKSDTVIIILHIFYRVELICDQAKGQIHILSLFRLILYNIKEINFYGKHTNVDCYSSRSQPLFYTDLNCIIMDTCTLAVFYDSVMNIRVTKFFCSKRHVILVLLFEILSFGVKDSNHPLLVM